MAKTEEKDLDLEELVASVTQSSEEAQKAEPEEAPAIKEEAESEGQRIDVLNLPPRRTIHDGARTGFRLRWNGVLVRFIILTVIVLAGISYIMLYTDVPSLLPDLF
ncbi:hypothetical protein [Terribacillus halophilus]|uniref:hypothetical protein n=1 Tax=Terribacillus halophilus TaxID=361279 RepID=UPI0009878AE8|nr:hypothetical protein [Terribacillus halophilus]